MGGAAQCSKHTPKMAGVMENGRVQWGGGRGRTRVAEATAEFDKFHPDAAMLENASTPEDGPTPDQVMVNLIKYKGTVSMRWDLPLSRALPKFETENAERIAHMFVSTL